jgi:hypothetical protein
LWIIFRYKVGWATLTFSRTHLVTLKLGINYKRVRTSRRVYNQHATSNSTLTERTAEWKHKLAKVVFWRIVFDRIGKLSQFSFWCQSHAHFRLTCKKGLFFNNAGPIALIFRTKKLRNIKNVHLPVCTDLVG